MALMFEASQTINASPGKVFQILADGARYPEWDKSMIRVEGRIALGESVKFYTTLQPEKPFPVRVTVFDPGHRIVLVAGMPVLFKSERTHSLAAQADGTTLFHTREVFSGLLAPIFGKKIPDLTENFRGFAAGLKAYAEAS